MRVPGLIEQTTTASILADLPVDPDLPARAWVALGSPCASVYVPVFPPAGVPPQLADPATWARFAALRDRVEADGATLASVRTALGPVEAELWAHADDVADDEQARAAFPEQAGHDIDVALTRLGV